MSRLILFNPILMILLIFGTVLCMFVQCFNALFSIFVNRKQKWIIVIECLISAFMISANIQLITLVNEEKRGNIYPLANDLLTADWILILSFSIIYILGLRATIQLIDKQYLLSKSINSFTVKHVMDTLDDGLLFTNEHDAVIFTNYAMYDICERIFDKQFQTGLDLWSEVTNKKEDNIFGKRKLNEQYLFRFLDITYEFSKEEIYIKNKIYTRYVAADVTLRDHSLQRLETQTNELMQTTKNLVWMRDHIEENKKEEAATKMMRRLHDVCAQRVSIIRRAMLSKQEMDYVYLEELLLGFSREMELGLSGDPGEELVDITESFQNIGMEIQIHGEMPESENIRIALGKVIREAATNALSHAKANKMDIYILALAKGIKVEIYNDGEPPQGKLIEGNGIAGMREHVKRISGLFEIKNTPTFKIVIYLF